jgi:hypothetical protein
MREKLRTALGFQIRLHETLKELIPLLEKYSTNYHWALCDIDEQNITIDDQYVSFKASGNCRGWFEEHFSVKWDYFDNPEQYIENEKKQKEEQERQAKEKEKLHQEQFERAHYEKLKAKYG